MLSKLRKTKPHLWPQLIMVDGNGILHPRGLGLASHLGVLLDVPTLGVAKKFLAVDGMTRENQVDDWEKQLLQFGDSVPLRGNSGRLYGLAIRTHSVHPLFISPGHRVSLDTVKRVVLACSSVRIPTPIRQADLGSREAIRKWEAAGSPTPKPVDTSEVDELLSQTRFVMDDDVDAMQARAYPIRPLLDGSTSIPNWHLLHLERTPEALALRSRADAELKTKQAATPLQLTLICDCSGSMGNNYKNLLIPACADLYRALKPSTCDMFLFGRHVTHRPVTSVGDIIASQSKELEDATDIPKAIEAAVEATLKRDVGSIAATISAPAPTISTSQAADLLVKDTKTAACVCPPGMFAFLRSADAYLTYYHTTRASMSYS
jgi:hypothetical protein